MCTLIRVVFVLLFPQILSERIDSYVTTDGIEFEGIIPSANKSAKIFNRTMENSSLNNEPISEQELIPSAEANESGQSRDEEYQKKGNKSIAGQGLGGEILSKDATSYSNNIKPKSDSTINENIFPGTETYQGSQTMENLTSIHVESGNENLSEDVEENLTEKNGFHGTTFQNRIDDSIEENFQGSTKPAQETDKIQDQLSSHADKISTDHLLAIQESYSTEGATSNNEYAENEQSIMIRNYSSIKVPESEQSAANLNTETYWRTGEGEMDRAMLTWNDFDRINLTSSEEPLDMGTISVSGGDLWARAKETNDRSTFLVNETVQLTEGFEDLLGDEDESKDSISFSINDDFGTEELTATRHTEVFSGPETSEQILLNMPTLGEGVGGYSSNRNESLKTNTSTAIKEEIIFDPLGEISDIADSRVVEKRRDLSSTSVNSIQNDTLANTSNNVSEDNSFVPETSSWPKAEEISSTISRTDEASRIKTAEHFIGTQNKEKNVLNSSKDNLTTLNNITAVNSEFTPEQKSTNQTGLSTYQLSEPNATNNTVVGGGILNNSIESVESTTKSGKGNLNETFITMGASIGETTLSAKLLQLSSESMIALKIQKQVNRSSATNQSLSKIFLQPTSNESVQLPVEHPVSEHTTSLMVKSTSTNLTTVAEQGCEKGAVFISTKANSAGAMCIKAGSETIITDGETTTSLQDPTDSSFEAEVSSTKHSLNSHKSEYTSQREDEEEDKWIEELLNTTVIPVERSETIITDGETTTSLQGRTDSSVQSNESLRPGNNSLHEEGTNENAKGGTINILGIVLGCIAALIVIVIAVAAPIYLLYYR